MAAAARSALASAAVRGDVRMNIDDVVNRKLDKAACAEMARAKGDEMTDCIHNWDLTYSGVEIRCKKCGLVLDDSEVLDRMVMLESDLADTQSQLTARDELIERLVEVGEFFSGGFEHDVFGVLANGNEAYGYDEGVVRGNEFLEEIQSRLNALVSEWQAMKGGGE